MKTDLPAALWPVTTRRTFLGIAFLATHKLGHSCPSIAMAAKASNKLGGQG
jgi:hypothetical protein